MVEKQMIPKLNKDISDRRYERFSIEISRRVLTAYLIAGYSHRRIDREILGFDDKKTRGFKTMGILHNLGIDSSFKGYFNNFTEVELLDILSSDDSYHEICGILSYDVAVKLPPLVKKRRKTEFGRYSITVIRDVIIQYIVEGKTHRQIDATVLGLDPKKSKGFQSFSILNFLGLNGPFKGIAKKCGLENIVKAFAESEDDYSSILQILKQVTDREPCIFTQTEEGTCEIIEDDFIELILTDYSLHGGQKKKR